MLTNTRGICPSISKKSLDIKNAKHYNLISTINKQIQALANTIKLKKSYFCKKQITKMRFPAREVYIGEVPLGGRNPIRLQSMTNTDTSDIKSTIAQCIRIYDAGADYSRISVPSLKNIQHLKEIKEGLKKLGYSKPLIADIHFKPEIALEAARIVEKVRINPGNYTDKPKQSKAEWTEQDYSIDLERMESNLYPLIKICKDYGTAIRIGTNFGSLSDRIISRYGNTPQAMVESTMEFLRIFEKHSFDKTIISLKASNPLLMVQSYSLMTEKLIEEGIFCPIHVGVTEAGEGENGRIKSALGISTLLAEGIGDTVRVSLSEPPEAEIPVAISITKPFQSEFSKSTVIGNFIPPEFEISSKHYSLPNKHNAIVILNWEKSCLNNNDIISPDIIWIERKEEISNTFDSNQYYLTSSEEILKGSRDNIFPLFNIKNKSFDITSKKFNFFLIRDIESLSKLNTIEKIPNPVLIIELNEKFTLNNLKDASNSLFQFPVIIKKEYDAFSAKDLSIQISSDFGKLLLERKIQGLWIKNVGIECCDITNILINLFQASGIRISKTEFVSCPTCSRTSYDLEKLLVEIQKETSNLPGIKIAVMGCMVNGPGEMADADFGFIGTAGGKVNLYKGKAAVVKNIPIDNAKSELLKILKSEGLI
jgi:(E)-4-hydroxy-3-methylbut-2-enyl-diphosphate synthase